MRVAIVGAGVAGLTAGVALQRDGHDVRIHEQASELRTGGFGFNLWTNATSPLSALGVEIQGEPFDHMNLRTGGKQRTSVRTPTRRTPHMNGERGALLRAIHGALAPGTVQFNSRIESTGDLLRDGADLVVAADGVGSRLRPDAGRKQKISKPWSVWQAVIPTGGDLIEVGGGAIVLSRTRFYGLWRQPNNEICWFVEEPGAPSGLTPAQMLERIKTEDDALVQAIAERTPVESFGEWLARDRRPTRGIIADRVVAIGDAAHPMLPCIGQGACTSIEDGIALAVALRGRSAPEALEVYRRRRLLTTWNRVAFAHLACLMRNPGPLAGAIASTPVVIPFAQLAGLWMRLMNRADRRLMRELASPRNT